MFIFLFFLTLHPQLPHFFLGYTPGGAAVPSAPLLPAVMTVLYIVRGMTSRDYVIFLINIFFYIYLYLFTEIHCEPAELAHVFSVLFNIKFNSRLFV